MVFGDAFAGHLMMLFGYKNFMSHLGFHILNDTYIQR